MQLADSQTLGTSPPKHCPKLSLPAQYFDQKKPFFEDRIRDSDVETKVTACQTLRGMVENCQAQSVTLDPGPRSISLKCFEMRFGHLKTTTSPDWVYVFHICISRWLGGELYMLLTILLF